jgi:alpha-L-arabinofuranosidase
MDYVSVHAFQPPVPGMRPLRDDEPDYWAVVAGPHALIRNVDDVLADIDRAFGANSPVRVSFDEWNLWCAWDDCVATNYDLRAGLMFAGVFNRIHERAPRVEIGMIAQLVNMLGIVQTDESRLFHTAASLVNRLYVEETRPLALECRVESETFDTPVWPDVPENLQPMMGEELTGIPYLDASATASQDRRRLAVFLVNRYLDQPLAVDLTFDGMESPSSGRLRQLAAESPFARNDFEHPDRLRIEERPVSSVARLELPPHSVSALVLG